MRNLPGFWRPDNGFCTRSLSKSLHQPHNIGVPRVRGQALHSPDYLVIVGLRCRGSITGVDEKKGQSPPSRVAQGASRSHVHCILLISSPTGGALNLAYIAAPVTRAPTRVHVDREK